MNPDLQKRLASLPPDKIRALMEKIGGNARASGLGPIKIEVGKHYPLSSAQKRIWFLCQLAPGSPIYNNPLSIRIATSEPQDPARLESGLKELARRHTILRTTFIDVDGTPVQIVRDELDIKVDLHDFRQLDNDHREAAAQDIARAEGRRVFDLVNGPLLYCAMVRVADDEYIFLFTPHHLVSDGWSNMIFAEELTAIVAALSKGERVTIPEPKFQYIDFVYWERDWLKGDSFQKSLEYWKGQLADAPAPLRLPTEGPRPAAMTYAGSMEEMKLDPALQVALKKFCREQSITFYQLLLATFNVLLFRYTGESDLVVGMPVANRNRTEFQKVLGLFTNTLALRTSLDGKMTFARFLLDVKDVVAQALAHQRLPFEILIEELNPSRNLSIQPIYQVLLAQQTVPAAMKRFKVDYLSSKIDLNLWIEEGDEGASFTMTYASHIFSPETARRFLTHFNWLLANAIAAPELPISQIEYISDEERNDILSRSRSPVLSNKVEPERTFLDLFDEQVSQGPDRAAVQHAEDMLTFAELNRRANQIAHFLISKGVGVESRVGLLSDRTPRSIAALLGIMKAGAAYLPLDPAFPVERRKLMLKDAGADLVLLDRSFQADVAAMDIATCFLDSADIAGADESKPDVGLRPEKLAYVIYTSGTTGAPKGVCVEHRHLASYCQAIWKAMKLLPGSRCATVSSLAADLGNTMIFPPLAFGGCIDVIPRELLTDAAGLCRYFSDYPADCLKIVPSHLQSLLDGEETPELIPGKLLILAGEACPPGLVATVQGQRPDCRILNSYGPTETTISALTHELGPKDSDTGPAGTEIPIGRPLVGSEVYLLDEEAGLIPQGISGEIWIGGERVARGYWNNDELTADRFLPNPFWDQKGRIYRTGDKGKMLSDGSLVFQGRIDRQIKLRGFRVELGEIETALLRQPWIDQAVVVPPAADDPRQAIVAYIKAGSNATPDPEALKNDLARWLPPHAIPSTFVVLDEIPLTHNGKTDFRALSRPGSPRPEHAAAAPRDPIEIRLIQIWEEILGIDGIGIQDNFFELGGHSLLAVRLMSRIDKAFKVRLPLASLFDFGSIKHLSSLIRSEKEVETTSPLVSIQPQGMDAPMYFVHPAGGNVLCYFDLAKNLGTRQPFYGLQATPHSEPAKCSRSIQQMADGYLSAVHDAHPDRVPHYGGWSMGALVAFEMARLDQESRGQLPTVFILDQMAPSCCPVEGAEDTDELSRLVSFGAKVSMLIGQDLGLERHLLKDKSPLECAQEFLTRFKKHQMTPEDTSVTDFAGFLDLMLHHNRITSAYAPEPYAGKVVVIHAQSPLPVDPKLAAAMGAPPERAPDLGWQNFSRLPIDIIHVPGNHITMVTKPNVEVMASRISRWLDTQASGFQRSTAS